IQSDKLKAAYDRPSDAERSLSRGTSATVVLGTPQLRTTILGSTNVITNGSFETAFSGWTVYNEALGSGDWYAQTGTLSPLTNFYSVPAPTNGTYAAMTDQYGPGSHILYQDFTVPAGAELSYDRFIGNRPGIFFTPSTLSYAISAGSNQQARVDIMDPSATVTDLGTGVLAAIYATAVGDPPVSGYTNQTASLSALAGQSVRLRFSEVDNTGYFNMGIDNVSVRTTSTGLCASVQLLVTKKGIRTSLCDKLAQAAAYATAGATADQNGVLRAFINEVQAQTGKSITSANAAILIAAATSLIAH
ncbi:MAG: hypothetical protein ABIZ36_10810, partial [Gemmatimonadaceae bacterium]